jgi:hypothetical protein
MIGEKHGRIGEKHGRAEATLERQGLEKQVKDKFK